MIICWSLWIADDRGFLSPQVFKAGHDIDKPIRLIVNSLLGFVGTHCNFWISHSQIFVMGLTQILTMNLTKLLFQEQLSVSYYYSYQLFSQAKVKFGALTGRQPPDLPQFFIFLAILICQSFWLNLFISINFYLILLISWFSPQLCNIFLLSLCYQC